MKRAISALNCQLDEKIAPLFYKCRMFCIHDSNLERVDYFENPFYKANDGYEKELVAWLVKQGVQEAYSVKFRDKVKSLLSQATIRVIEFPNQERTIEEVIETFEW